MSKTLSSAECYAFFASTSSIRHVLVGLSYGELHNVWGRKTYQRTHLQKKSGPLQVLKSFWSDQSWIFWCKGNRSTGSELMVIKPWFEKGVIRDCSLQSYSGHPFSSPLSKNSRNTVYKLRFANVLGRINGDLKRVIWDCSLQRLWTPLFQPFVQEFSEHGLQIMVCESPNQ